jgi:hypothetical protein
MAQPYLTIAPRNPIAAGTAWDNTMGYAPNATKRILPLFGEVIINAGNISGADNDITDINKQYLLRETGILEKIHENNRVLDGLSSPATYLMNMNQDINRIADELSAAYNNELMQHYNLGKSIETSREEALSYVKRLKEEKMKLHHKKFPTKLTDEVVGRIDRRNQIGPLI